MSKTRFAAPSAMYQVVEGASTASALWPPRFSYQYIVRSTTIGTPLVDSTTAETAPSAIVALTRMRLRLVAATTTSDSTVGAPPVC